MNRDTRLMALALLLWGLGEGLFFHIQPLYFERLGATPVQIGGLLAAMSVVSLLTLIPAGILADLLPRKWLLVAGWSLGPVSALSIALAQTWKGLVPGLLLYAASACCIPVLNAYVAHAVDGQDLERTYTTVFAGYLAGGVISPALGGSLAGLTGMRVIYGIAGCFFGMSAFVILFLSPQPVPENRRPLGSLSVLMTRRYARFALITLSMFVAMYLAFALAPNFLAEVRHYDVVRIGALGSVQALGATVLTISLGRMSQGNAIRGQAVGQMMVWLAVLLLLLTGRFSLLAVGYFLRGATQGCRSLAQARAGGLCVGTERGLVLGATETTMALAQAIAPYLAGWLYAAQPASPIVASLVLLPVTTLVVIYGSRHI